MHAPSADSASTLRGELGFTVAAPRQLGWQGRPPILLLVWMPSTPSGLRPGDAAQADAADREGLDETSLVAEPPALASPGDEAVNSESQQQARRRIPAQPPRCSLPTAADSCVNRAVRRRICVVGTFRAGRPPCSFLLPLEADPLSFFLFLFVLLSSSPSSPAPSSAPRPPWPRTIPTSRTSETPAGSSTGSCRPPTPSSPRLGATQYAHGLTAIPPSRFAGTDANSLWEYAPFLCGAGLEEALEEAYCCSLPVLDRTPEVLLAVHLHNMLVQTGYLARPVGLYATLQDLFAAAFFDGGQAPTKDFDAALLQHTDAFRAAARRRPCRPPRTGSAANAVAPERNGLFTKKSYLVACSTAGWDVDRIRDADVRVPSILGVLRLGRTKHVRDPATGQWRMADTDLVRLLRAEGRTEESLLAIQPLYARLVEALGPRRMQGPTDAERCLPPAVREGILPPGWTLAGGGSGKATLSGPNLLAMLRTDLVSDVCGQLPLSSFDYVWGMVQCMMLFERFEVQLQAMRHPVFALVYEQPPGGGRHPWAAQKRVGLAWEALRAQDPALLRAMADVFESPRLGFTTHIYWDSLELDEDMPAEASQAPEAPSGDGMCALM